MEAHLSPRSTRVLVLLLSLTSVHFAFSQVTWSWVAPNFTPCEGVGINGTYTVTVHANIVTDDSGAKTINSLSVFASSAAFSSENNPSITAALDVTSIPAPEQTITLGPPPPNSIGESQGANETPHLYLPSGTVVPIASNTKLGFSVSATIQTPSGTCAVGSTSNTIDPNQPPNADADQGMAIGARRVGRSEQSDADLPAGGQGASQSGAVDWHLPLKLPPGAQRRISFTISLTSPVDTEVTGNLTLESGPTAFFTSNVLIRALANAQATLHIPDVSIPDGISEVTVAIRGHSLPPVPAGALKIGAGASSR